MKRRNHCLGLTCDDGGAGDDCMCPCDGCSRCACGCLEPTRQGFEQSGVRGIWVGRGAGYQLVKLPVGWDVLTPGGVGLLLPEDQRPQTFDDANALAVRMAREAGHGHP